MSFRHTMRGRMLVAATALSLFALPALAQVTVAGVTLPESQQVEGKTLELNGAGLRTKVIRLYVGGLYLENPTTNPQEAVTSKQVKRMELHVLRNLTKEQVGETIVEGFQKNTKDMSKLQDRLTRLSNALPDLQRGQTLTVTYVPGKGTTVEGPGIQPITIEGEDFAQSLFAVWLGGNPVQQDLKNALLQGGSERTAQR